MKRMTGHSYNYKQQALTAARGKDVIWTDRTGAKPLCKGVLARTADRADAWIIQEHGLALMPEFSSERVAGVFFREDAILIVPR